MEEENTQVNKIQTIKNEDQDIKTQRDENQTNKASKQGS